ncbi:MAG: GNAT family N-acetyltransferase [Nitrososphaerota archaeon]
MSHSIRAASKNDIPSILNLLYQLKRPKPKTRSENARFGKQILRYLSDADKKILVAESDSGIIGLVSLVFIPRLNRTKLELYIPELVVAKGSRRSGVGESLIEYCIGIAKKKKCFRMRLESGYQRREAHKFYKKLGFEQSALSYTFKT